MSIYYVCMCINMKIYLCICSIVNNKCYSNIKKTYTDMGDSMTDTFRKKNFKKLVKKKDKFMKSFQ